MSAATASWLSAGGSALMSQGTPTGWDLLDAARTALRAAVHGIGAEDSRPTPCAEWNVTQVLQHAAGDQRAWAAAITGGEPPAENPFMPSGQLDNSPVAVLDAALEDSAAAWAALSPDADELGTPLPQGALPPGLAAAACALDAAVHGWDIAVATGQDSPLTAAMAAQLMTAATQIVEPLRGFAYAAPLDADTGDEAAVLLRYLGRQPSWTAPA
jgi:uncharacterized protein (TIGR03086 family)